MAGERVLIIEDNEKNMKLVRDILQAMGYSPLEAFTGEQGLALAAENGLGVRLDWHRRLSAPIERRQLGDPDPGGSPHAVDGPVRSDGYARLALV